MMNAAIKGLTGIVVVLTGRAVHAAPTFTPIGDLPGGGFYSQLHGVSANGSLPVGDSVVGGGGFNLITSPCIYGDGGLVSLGLLGTSSARAVNADGTAITGVCDFGSFDPRGTQAFLWTPSTGIMLLGDLDGGVSVVPRSIGRAISANGLTIAGIGESDRGTEAFRYDVSVGTFTPLGSLAASPFGSWAYGMSADGNVIVGLSLNALGQQEPVRWTSTGLQAMGFLPGATGVTPAGAAYAASADGSVIVGQSRSVASGQGGEAFRWTADGGMQPLGDLPGGAFQSSAYACSADGNIIVGRASVQGNCGPFGCGSVGQAFIWDAQNGMQNLTQILTFGGIDLTGWRLEEARGVSANGRVIVGVGVNPQGLTEGWIADLGSPECRADFNADTVVDFFDYLDFVSAFADGSMTADFNIDGVLDLFDYLDFVAQFAVGC
ncbi:MAG: PEP-CTERM sorting domain-containing protein [Planctomycetes bacterium]|nr:PEP-CTERM sorting domain-containing protein [Planctomycetota bacterium]